MIISPLFFIGTIVAMFLDVFGLICLGISRWISPIVGELLSSVLDFLGTIFFTAWSIMAGGGIAAKKTIGTQKTTKKWLLKFITTNIIERIPLIGDFVPTWLVYVIKMKKGAKGDDKIKKLEK